MRKLELGLVASDSDEYPLVILVILSESLAATSLRDVLLIIAHTVQVGNLRNITPILRRL